MKKNTKQFSVRWMLLATLVVAWVLAVNNWLPNGYGWRSCIACAVFGSMVVLLDRRTIIGTLIGFFVMGIVGYFLVVGHRPPSVRFYKAMLVVMSYGGAAGSGVNALLLGHRFLGTVAVLVSVIGFGVILWIN